MLLPIDLSSLSTRESLEKSHLKQPRKKKTGISAFYLKFDVKNDEK